ncbi:MAG: CYTH domain-containing protein [Pseudomonadota bacterium]|nr:CYTH domain-containing protein [Pseudomonadota bacterium]
MAIEIERKFLVMGDGWRARVTRSVAMRQGYLSREAGKASVRVRLEDGVANLNIKAAVVGSARAEFEYAIDPAEAAEILGSLCVGRVEKTRHYVEVDGLVWEIDEFTGDNAGLIVAELELASVDQAFGRPDWLGHEVTEERRYYNHALSQRPFAQWSDAERDHAN